jgi:hypothetical protein
MVNTAGQVFAIAPPNTGSYGGDRPDEMLMQGHAIRSEEPDPWLMMVFKSEEKSCCCL